MAELNVRLFALIPSSGDRTLQSHHCATEPRRPYIFYYSYIITNYIQFQIEIYESNDGNFLSAGEMPLPALYSMMSLIFFLSAGFWTFILKTSRHKVYRIHILMCVLVYLKAMSLAFHGINYHFIQTRGEHVTAWAILYYITHL